MKTFTCLVICLSLVNVLPAFSQVGIGTNSPNSSAILDVQSTSKGMRVPLVSSDQRKAIASPGVGLIVFDTDQRRLFIYDGNQWTPVNMSGGNEIIPVRGPSTGSGPGDAFGWAVDISGNFAITGAPGETGLADNTGAVFIYRKTNTGWQAPVKLFANDGVSGDFFGISVAIDSPFAIVGAYGKASHKGAAYIFTFNGTSWGEIPTKIVAADGAADDEFGSAVDITFNGGNRAIIGAPFNNHSSATDPGAAYIFNGAGGVWTLEQKINMTSPQTNDQFGSSVAIDGNYALVGSPYDDFRNDPFATLFPDQGSASLFNHGATWTETAKFSLSQHTSGQGNAHFGYAVALNTGVSVVGAPDYGSSGGAWIYNNTGGVFAQCLVPASTTNPRFGYDVGITDNYVLVSSPSKNISPYYQSSGAVFSFNAANGAFQNIIENPNPGNTNFGASLGVSGKNYIIGANQNLGTIYFGSF
jgi:hypothetical protein